ncbi:CopM family metallochaperone [Rhizobium rosettiformans]|uniref:CopM family metallochaperone n=1 Tax=Rhizobium rosettiformans TaxID=1368430 RepID=UPI0028566EE3|nr:DUF305 domain-containing protein [Rhizobium rosettiformans]MDR7031096.1 uncharacterized protein (DUF305 family) [Rhizobium rosettiformans]MDR7067000.1 uncharacterized protein (DUF305 family) [Rhizobium rosettiformans]
MTTCVKNTAAALALSCAMWASAGSAAAQPTFPEKCKSDAPMSEMSMPGMAMPGGHMTMEGSGSDRMANLSDHHKASMEGMMSMHQNMMQGMMQEDADVAFACGMIAHHIGAISMAEVELKYGDNEEMKATAQEIIDAQTKEIEELTAWVDREAE